MAPHAGRGREGVRGAERLADSVPALAYKRVSKAREEMISPEVQDKAIRHWADDNGRRVVDTVSDLNESGRGFAKRKIAAMIERVAAGEAVEILVYRYDRWGRNAAESLANIARVEQAGGRVVSVTEPFDPETAVGKYTRGNALLLAEMQSNIISENWKSALDHRRENGLPTNGLRRFGYTVTPKSNGGDGRFRIDPVTGPILVELYQRASMGESTYQLARWLNSIGIKPPRSRDGLWSARSLDDILNTGFGAGLLIVDCHRPTQHWVPGAHEALIDRETWDTYRAVRESRVKLPPRARVATYRLTGLTMCGHCGGPAIHTSNKSGVTGRTMMCSRHRNHSICVPLSTTRLAAEAAVREWLAHQYKGRGARFAREQQLASAGAQRHSDTDQLRRDLEDIRRRLVRAADAYTREIMDEMSYVRLRTELADRQALIEESLTAHRAGPAPLPPRAFRDVLEVWDHPDVPAHRINAALRSVVGAVLVRREYVLVMGTWELR